MQTRSWAPVAALALSAFLVTPPLLGPLAGQGSPSEAQELRAELLDVQQRLLPIRQEAMQDEELQRQQQELQQKVSAAMSEIDPEASEKLARLDEINVEMREAQAEGDQQGVGALIHEMQRLQEELQQTQAAVMGQEEIQRDIESFRKALFAKMIELDQDAEELLERADEIEERLAVAEGGLDA